MKLINKKYYGKCKVRDLTIKNNHNFIISDVVVHNCHSYKIAEYLAKHVDKNQSARLLTHTTKDRDEILDRHISSNKATVLLTPSMSEGIDLKDELSRFQIVCKVPFPFLGDKRVVLKKKLHPWWYPYATARILVQGLGRSIRNEEDYATSYILDEDWLYFFKRNQNLFPKWFIESVV